MFHTKCVDGSTWDFTIHSPAIFAMLSFLDFRVARVALVKLSRLPASGSQDLFLIGFDCSTSQRVSQCQVAVNTHVIVGLLAP